MSVLEPGEAVGDADRPAGRRVARNAALLSGATLVSRALTFVLGVVIARMLGAVDYGRYGVAIAVATILLPLADLGTTPFVSREAARDRSLADGVARRLAGVRLATSVVLAGSVAAGAWLLLDDHLLAAAVSLVLLAALADGMSQFVYGYFQGREQMGFEALTTSAVALLRTVGGVVTAVVGRRLVPLLLWLVAVSGVQLLVAGRRLWRAIVTAPPTASRVDWRTVGAMGMTTVFVMVYLRADTVMIGWLLGTREAGHYTAAYTIMSSLQIVPWMVALALTPVFTRSHGRDDALFRTSWDEGVRIVLLISLPLALVTALLAGPVVSRVFGEGFSASSTTLAILVWSCPMASLNALVAAIMRSIGREGRLAVVTLAGAVLNVTLNLWAIPAVGIHGAAATTITAELIVLVALSAVVVRHRAVGRPHLPLGGLVAGLSVLAALAALTSPLPVELRALAALGGYGAVVMATGAVSRDDVARLRAVARSS